MRELILAAITVAAGLALNAAVVFLGGDRATLVPPPDAVAEVFVRQLATHRFDRALPHLSRRLRQELDRDRLSSLVAALEAQSGSITFAEGAERSRTREHASAVVHTKTDRRQTPTFEFELISQRGEWKISAWERLLQRPTEEAP